eukprot:scaffold70997_cov16-Tisochrysis_lutea.AAC.1
MAAAAAARFCTHFCSALLCLLANSHQVRAQHPNDCCALVICTTHIDGEQQCGVRKGFCNECANSLSQEAEQPTGVSSFLQSQSQWCKL